MTRHLFFPLSVTNDGKTIDVRDASDGRVCWSLRSALNHLRAERRDKRNNDYSLAMHEGKINRRLARSGAARPPIAHADVSAADNRKYGSIYPAREPRQHLIPLPSIDATTSIWEHNCRSHWFRLQAEESDHNSCHTRWIFIGLSAV